MSAVRVTPTPIRAEELVLQLATFHVGQFTVFVPSALLSDTGDVAAADPKVHVFFAAGGVQGDKANDVLVHGLRSASRDSEWITIGVRGTQGGATTIRSADIQSCLDQIGATGTPSSLRLTGHSRGCDSMVSSLNLIGPKQLIDRVVFLDEAVEHVDQGANAGAIRLNRVLTVKQLGVPPEKIVCYEVGNVSFDYAANRSVRVPGATYFQLPVDGMAAVGCVRLLGDGFVRMPALGVTVAANPAIVGQIAPMLMPARWGFAVAGAGVDLNQFCIDHAPAIAQIKANASSANSLLGLVNANDLTGYKPYVFSWGIAAHHFFVAEIAHELTN